MIAYAKFERSGMITMIKTAIVIIAAFIVTCLCNRWLGRWACDLMGWHLAPDHQGFDGCSFFGICPRCGKRVLLDSQGNWF